MGRFPHSVIVDCEAGAMAGARVFDVGLVCAHLYSVWRQDVKFQRTFNCCLETGSGVSKVSLFPASTLAIESFSKFMLGFGKS